MEVAEQFADGNAPLGDLQEARAPLYTLADHACHNATEVFTEIEDGTVIADCTAENAAWGAAKHGAIPPDDDGLSRIFNAQVFVEKGIQCNLLHCVCANPFRPVALDSTWLTSNVIGLAQTIYEERDFNRLPILADALEEAGCSEVATLEHCRGTGLHVRWCWVVDLLLGKE